MSNLLAKMKCWAYNNFNIEIILDGAFHERIIENGGSGQSFNNFSG